MCKHEPKTADIEQPTVRARRVALAEAEAVLAARLNGLWVSVEGENDWREWCVSNDFALGRLTHMHEIALAKDAKVLRLSSVRDIDDLTHRYGCVPMSYVPDCVGIDWRRVATDYEGIIIAPYILSRRLHDGSNWYYGWDCASGCIWDAAAVDCVTLGEVVVALEPADTE